MQGAFNLKTKNMQRVMNKRDKSETDAKKVQEAQIVDSETEEQLDHSKEVKRKPLNYDHIK